MRDLLKMFYPESVAVIGASREANKLGHILLKNLIDGGYEGEIYPVNPKAEEILGMKVYADIESLPSTPAMALISIPSQFVIETLRQLGEKGTRQVVIITAGFKETGTEGEKLEQELLKAAEEYGINIMGPNCLGLVNNRHKMNATFGKGVDTVGTLRFISQSGAIATAIFDWADSCSMGFDQFVTLGNKSQLSENDMLEYWLHQEPSNNDFDAAVEKQKGLSGYRPIGMYLESIVDGEKFVRLCQELSGEQPLFVLKPGKSEGAQKAMQSHTGSMAGSDKVFEQALKEAGVIRCEGIEDLFDLCRAFTWEEAPKGPKIAVVSNAGGPAVITSDFIELEGLELAEISEEAEAQMKKALPLAAALHNPVDVLGDALAPRYLAAMEAVLSEHEVHAMMVILTPQVMTEIEETAQAVVEMSKKYGKPIVCSFMGGREIAEGEKVLDQYKIPSFRFPERAVRALAKMRAWDKQISEIRYQKSGEATFKATFDEVHHLVNSVHSTGRKVLTSVEANSLLRMAGVPVPAEELVEHFEQEVHFAEREGYPVVLKISSAKMLHKIDSGGVVLNITTRKALHKAFGKLQTKVEKMRQEGDETAGIQIQKQIVVPKGTSSLEVIVGVKRDSSFGGVMMFGAGGTLAELLDEVELGLLPMDAVKAEEMIKRSRLGKLLGGYRGSKPYDLTGLVQTMMGLSQVFMAVPEIGEIEINPVIMTPEETWAVDGKVVLVG